ncbi:hypothetical protein HLK59_17510 [Streptomyces sp. S3(2020)]|uniref:hypothetical protein n=1 Tax=Streptomyces sp. S3(2020) TaxID=2732044 RepID=UPI001488FFCF|nr:hypothetical protein [Streptomyces sp. S3(2020)]NNN32128.1 hypothetical protein [Streptomyces sp. S3(2020)]
MEFDDRQRRIRRSPLLFVAPLVLLILLTLVLLWEIVRSNITGDLARQWPWRLRLMDMNPLGALLAVALAAVFGRAQYARTVRPAMGWSSAWTVGDLGPDEPGWRVDVVNGGSQHAVVEETHYCFVPRGGEAGEWTDHAGLIRALADHGLVAGKDYYLQLTGPGFPLGAGGMRAGTYGRRFVDEIDQLRLRLRVTDAVGDSHERVMDLMRGARNERPGS